MAKGTLKFGFIIQVFCATALSSTVLVGQSGVILTGFVQDQSGAAVAGVKIALIRGTSNSAQETTSGENGSFSFNDVSLGDYLLKAEAPGFDSHQEALTVGSQELRPFRIELKVESVKQRVTVTLDPEDEVSTSESNTASIKFDDDLLNALPTDPDDILPLINRFVLPATQGAEGTAVVVDGVEGTEVDVPSTAIRRGRINQNPYSAAFQRPGTGRVEITTKRGHRSHYEGQLAISARNAVFDARNAFAESTPDLDRRFVQAKLGGPLVGRRSSLYVAAESLMKDESTVVNAVTLTGPLIANVPTEERHYRTFTRLQWWPSDAHTLYGTYEFRNKSRQNDQVGGFHLPEQGISKRGYSHKLTFGDSAIFSGNSRNEFHLFFQREDGRNGGLATAPEIIVNDAFTGGPSQLFKQEKKQSFDLTDTVTYVYRKHLLLFGGKIRRDRVHSTDASNFGGTFEFSGLSQFAAGTPYVFRINQGSPEVAFTVYESSGFLQDEIRLRSSLTMTLGVRYSWQSKTSDRDNVAPRFALAFAAGGKKKTVLRMGAGIFYDDLPRAATERSLLFNGVRLRHLVISNPSFPNPFSADELNSPLPSVTRVAPDIQSPYLLDASGGVERELWHSNSLQLEYKFVRGVNLFRSRNINAPLPATGLRPDANFGNIDQIESTALLRGNALAVTFNGKIGRFFKPYAQYLFSRSTDDTSGTFSLPADNYDLRPEIGPSDFDRRHRLNLMGVVKVRQGFQVGTVLSLASGPPFNISTGMDDNGDSVANDRPFGTTRNTGRGPGRMQLDLRIKKLFTVSRLWNSERDHGTKHILEFSIDAFNVTNHTNVSGIVGVLSSPFFGHANSAETARRFQMSVSYGFPQ
jgi:hypothetical protein